MTPRGQSEITVGFADSFDITERRPELLEDGSVAFFTDTIRVTSPWVDSDVETLFRGRGPYAVWGYWTNEDDGRLASAGATEARLIRAGHEGEGIRRYIFEFEAFSLA